MREIYPFENLWQNTFCIFLYHLHTRRANINIPRGHKVPKLSCTFIRNCKPGLSKDVKMYLNLIMQRIITMNEIPNEIQIAAMQMKYGLSYHINYAMHAQMLVGLRGKKILEVGGSLPREFVLDDLGAAKWVAIEHREYWDEVLSTGNVTGTPPPANESDETSVTSADSSRTNDYRLLFGSIETLPKSLFSTFDVVFSIAAFEHIARLPEALEQMYNALVPGGKLFSLFAPIWSSHSGHHLPSLNDKAGNIYDMSSSPIPPWGHLLYSPTELYDLLLQKCDAETAREIVYFVYNSPHINRFFLEDYLEIVARSSFTVSISAQQWAYPVPENVMSQLTRLHPKRSDFSSCGVLLVLERPLDNPVR
jgi:SAM-dependent methyltransferase